MSVTVVKEPGRYGFIGNSMTFEIHTDDFRELPVEVTCRGKTQRATCFPFNDGSRYRVVFDVSGYLHGTPEPGEYVSHEIVCVLSDFSVPYRVKISQEYVFEGIAFNGGISRELQKTLAANGYDIFTFRLGSAFGQFLFTTRTHSHRLRIRESELYPFVFIHPGIDLSFKSRSGNIITTSAQRPETVCLLDVERLRSDFYALYGELPSWMEVLAANEKAFEIDIVAGHVSEEKYLIKFRNSLGAYELLEVAGTAVHVPRIDEPDLYEAMTDLGFFARRRDRLSMQDVIKVETGYKSKEDILFVRDMVCSDECYFIFPDGTSFRCLVSVDAMSYRENPSAPQSVALIVTQENTSGYVSPSLDRSSLIMQDGIFDETFDLTFS